MKNDKLEAEELVSINNTTYSTSKTSNIQNNISLDNTIKLRLIIYAILSGIAYAYMILVPFSGLGMPVYAIFQFVLVLYLIWNRTEVKNKSAIFMFIPIITLTLSFFLRDTYRFKVFNIPVIFLLYSTMLLLFMDELGLKSQGLLFMRKIICTVFKPLIYFNIPLKWSFEGEKGNPSRTLMKKILIGITISIPCLIIITVLLMNADLVFENKVDLMFNSIDNIFGSLTILKIIMGTLAGFYLFGLFYIMFKNKNENFVEESGPTVKKENILSEGINSIKTITKPLAIKKPQGDVVIISVMLISILVIYSFFSIIQFKYLFAGASLPDDLSFAEYARRGFFELLFLSFINISIVLAVIYLTRDNIYNNGKSSTSAKLIKILMLYLCAITILLLASSFYRMTLYNNEYGLTELRILVVIFLLFEAIGLLVTFYYIIKPSFNIIAFYTVICLSFYLTINVLNLDYMIAKKNIDMHYAGKELDVNYLYILSSDAAPQMRRLLDDENYFVRQMALEYFEKIEYQASYTNDWRCFNLSRNNGKKIINEEKLVFIKD